MGHAHRRRVTPAAAKRRVCFVTGTRAEFGLMQSTLRAIAAHPALSLQIVATGMHVDRRRGETVREIASHGFKVDRIVPWARSDGPTKRAIATGRATAALAGTFDTLQSDLVLVVGDRVEAFAAATAGHLCDRIVAHVHGGDRALGQADDSLRHAITKLAHVHFPATKGSAQRIRSLGEDPWRIHVTGAPGIDGIVTQAISSDELTRWRARARRGCFALLCLHPTEPNPSIEGRRAKLVLQRVLAAGLESVFVVMPNNDPGAEGIAACWRSNRDPRVEVFTNLARTNYLGLLRDAAFLIGNSSSGIIEAASFGTPVIDIGPRQAGREHGTNVIHTSFDVAAIDRALRQSWRAGRPRRLKSKNPYASAKRSAAEQIASHLAGLEINHRLIRKLIVY